MFLFSSYALWATIAWMFFGWIGFWILPGMVGALSLAINQYLNLQGCEFAEFFRKFGMQCVFAVAVMTVTGVASFFLSRDAEEGKGEIRITRNEVIISYRINPFVPIESTWRVAPGDVGNVPVLARRMGGRWLLLLQEEGGIQEWRVGDRLIRDDSRALTLVRKSLTIRCAWVSAGRWGEMKRTFRLKFPKECGETKVSSTAYIPEGGLVAD